MQLFLHGNLGDAVAAALVAREHHTHRPATLDLPEGASASDLLAALDRRQWDLFTTDADLARAPFDHGASFNRSIVFFQVQGGEAEHLDAIQRLFDRFKRLNPGRLYTVTASRVKVRQLPTKK